MAEHLFLAWWLVENSIVHCLTFRFLLGVTGAEGRRHLPLWLAVNGAAAWWVMVLRPPAPFLLSVLILGVFAKAVLKLPTPDLVVPMMVIPTLCTLKEGFSALLLSWLSVSFRSPTGGVGEQILVPLLLDALLSAALGAVRKRCPPRPDGPAPSCRCLFVPACVFALLSIRWGLRLDCPGFAPYLAGFTTDTRWSALCLMLGAAVVLFTSFDAFGRVAGLSAREKLLEHQLAQLSERGRAYAACQHDIDNHLLVISGLLREKAFAQAEQYASRLKASGPTPPGAVSTGNLALDVLLREKLDTARQGHIAVEHDVYLGNFAAEDTDLCALFANLLDNAVTACLREPEGARFFSVSARVRAQLLVVESVNTTSASGPVRFGTGLNNVQRIAERYQGAVETELSGGRFQVRVLLCAR